MDVILSIPDIGFEQTRTVAGLMPGETASFTYSGVGIPEALEPGMHEVVVSCRLSVDSSKTKTFDFVVPESKIMASLDKLSYNVGEGITVRLENTGGVDTEFEGQLSLEDLTGRIHSQKSLYENILAGKENTISLGIPDQLVKGMYRLEVDGVDLRNNKRTHLRWVVHIQGLEASLEVSTDKQMYLSSEPIVGLSRIINGDFPISGGKLNLVVIAKGYDIYVSPDGSDTEGDGTILNPYATISKAILESESGKRIYVGQGSYTEDVAMKPGITLQGAGAEVTTINGRITGASEIKVDGFTLIGDGIWFEEQVANVVISNNVFTSHSSPSGVKSPGLRSVSSSEPVSFAERMKEIVKRNLPNLREGQERDNFHEEIRESVAAYKASGHHSKGIHFDDEADSITIFNNKFLDLDGWDNGVHFWWPVENVTVRDNTFNNLSGGCGGIKFWDDAKDVTVSNNKLSNLSGGCDGIQFWGGRVVNVIIANNTLDNFSGDFDGIHFEITEVKGIAIINNTLDNFLGYAHGIHFWNNSEDVTISNNRLSNLRGDPHGGIILWDPAVNVTITNNLLENLSGDQDGYLGGGIQIWSPAVNAIITNNSLHNLLGEGGGIHLWNEMENVILSRNILSDVSGDYSGMAVWGKGTSTLVSRNIILNSTYGLYGGRPWSLIGGVRVWGPPSEGWLFTNNTLVGNQTGIYEGGKNNTFQNNIVVSSTSYGIDGNLDSLFSHNDVWNNAVNYHNMSDLTGIDGNISADPLFVSSADLHLQANSPCIDAGTLIGTDIGVYEYGGEELIGYQPYEYESDFYPPAQEELDIIWQKELPIDQLANTTEDLITEIGQLGATGRCILKATLSSGSEQVVAEDFYVFYIYDGNLILFIDTDKEIYKVGDTVTITGRVENRTDTALTNITLVLNKSQDKTVNLYTKTLDLGAGDSYTFATSTSADTSFILQAKARDVEVVNHILVEDAGLEVDISCNDLVEKDTNTFRVSLNNLGKTDLVVNCMVDVAGDTRDYGRLTIGAGSLEAIEDKFSILDDDTITITLSGDVAGTWIKAIEFGEKVDLELLPEEIYPVGYQEIPFRLSNSGKMDSEFEVSFILQSETTSQAFSSPRLFKAPSPGSTGLKDQDILPAWCKGEPKIRIKDSGLMIKAPGLHHSPAVQDQASLINARAPRVSYSQGSIIISKAFYLPAGESIEGVLVYELEAGIYRLGYDYFRGTGSAQFRVAEDNLAELQTVNCKLQNANLEIEAEVENLGANEFAGALRLNTGFFEEERELSLGIGESRGETFTLTPNVAMGTYTAVAQILYNGNVIDEKSIEFVLEPDFEIGELEGLHYNIGESGTFTFVVKNIGGAEGQVEIGLDFDALDFDETKTLWLGPGETETVSFAVFVPDDLEDKDYRAVISIRYSVIGVEKEKEKEFWLHINGIKIEVEAELDRPLYEEGDTATLTLSIANLSLLPTLRMYAMYAKVKFNEYEEAKGFEIGADTQEIVTFDIPVRFTGEKISYGIYAQSGRAIYLNSLYIYEKGDIISLYTDKQVYLAGEEVVVTVESTEAGTLTLSRPGWSGSFSLDTGSWSTAFILPEDLVTGTYYLSYEFAFDSQSLSGEYPFDVIGYLARILECRLDKRSYAPEDRIEVKLRIDVNRNIYGTLKGWISDPIDEYTELFEHRDTFTEGENSLSLTSTFSTTHAGVHRMVYGFYQGDLMLASGGEDFDVGGMMLTSLFTDKTEYLNTLGPVELTIGIIGLDGTGRLMIEVDNELVLEEVVDGNGYFELNRSLQMESYDTHIISCTLTDSAGAVSKKEVMIVVVATPPVADVGDGISICSKSCINLQGKASGGTGVYTYSWNPTTGLDDPNTASPNACPDTTTTYTLTVTDSNGCTAADQVVVMVYSSPTANAGDDVSLYPKGCITLNASATGGTPPYAYVWTPSTGLDCPDSPTPNACPDTTTTYALTVTDSNGCVAEDQVVVIINPSLEMTIDIDPNTLNLKSKGKWITCYIELPSPYDVADIDISTLRISKIGDTDITPIFAESSPTGIGDYDQDGIPDLMVKFDRFSLSSILSPEDEVKITVEGGLKDGRGIIGHDTIRVINPDATKEGEVTSSDGKTRIKFSQGVIKEDDRVLISSPMGNSPSDPSGYYRISDSIVKIEVYNDSGDPITDFNPPATLVLHYPDADPNDGVVDRTSPRLDEMSLRIYTIEGGAWEEVSGSIVDPVENTVSATLARFSIYSLMGQAAPAEHLGQVIVYPNPFKPYKGHEKIHFTHLTDPVTIKIYDIAGELVRTIKESDGNGVATWDGKNEDRKNVASGIYIYYITNPQGEKCVGKIGIIR